MLDRPRACGGLWYRQPPRLCPGRTHDRRPVRERPGVGKGKHFLCGDEGIPEFNRCLQVIDCKMHKKMAARGRPLRA